jgi:hypothetical protein
MLQTIEDIVEYIKARDLASTSEKSIMYSLARQVSRGVSLTDRQHKYVKEALLQKKDVLISQFSSEEEFEKTLNNLRMPIRFIDRSKTIKIVNKTFCVSFPTNIKTVKILRELGQSLSEFYKVPDSREHFFKINELTVPKVLDALEGLGFEIDPELLDFYNELREAKLNKEKYVPGVFNGTLQNFKDSAVEFIERELGPYSPETSLLYFDRRNRLGISHIEIPVPSTLTGKIAARDKSEISINPEEYSMDRVVDSLYELKRFPLLVPVDKADSLEQVKAVHESVCRYFPSSQQIVLFRVENKNNEYNLNNYIKEHQFNNWLDDTIKVVYINKDTLPKLLVKEKWRPIAVFSSTSIRMSTPVQTYIQETADLIVWHDKELSMIKKK